MREPVIAICDREMNYACHLMEYLKDHLGVKSPISVFSGEEKLLSFVEAEEAAILIIAQSCYSQEIRERGYKPVLVLNESERYLDDEVPNVSKYQSMQTIAEMIVKLYAEHGTVLPAAIRHGSPLTILGFYSPVSRCLQTTMAFSMGEQLSRTGGALYVNMECYPGLDFLDGGKENLMDLLYYSECAKEKFSSRLQLCVQSVNGLDVICPGGGFTELQEIRPAQWQGFFDMIDQVTEYRYLLLDLSEAVRGLFDILRRCGRIYTIVKEDSVSNAKLRDYEELLKRTHYEDIFTRTVKCPLPLFRELPASMENMDRGEFAETVRRILEESRQTEHSL